MLKRLDGNIVFSSVASMFLIVLVLLVMMYTICLRIVNEAIIRVEDGIAVSCLASLQVDMEQYVESRLEEVKKLVISDYEKAYEIFSDSLEMNLGLQDDFFNPYSNVVVEQYVVYNVLRTSADDAEGIIMIYEFGEDGNMLFSTDTYGDLRAPNGILVEETSVYAKVRFQVEGLFGYVFEGNKQLLTGVKYK